jgi:hypothetical protein
MVTDAGKVSTSRRLSRSGASIGVLVFGYVVVTACGGRSALLDDTTFVGEGGDGEEGGTYGVGGSYGDGGTSSPQGGTVGKAGTYGKAGFGAGGSYGKAGTGWGGAYYGGYAGQYYGGYAGTYLAGYGGQYYGGYAGFFTGGYSGAPYPGGFGGSVYPGGYGGTFGKAGYGGTTGKGGKGGGKGGGGGKGTNPDVFDSCASACKNMPPVCLGERSVEDCYSGCVDGASASPDCSYAVVDYVYCVAGQMWPDAECSYIDGVCSGYGCLQNASNICSGYLDEYSRCVTGNTCAVTGASQTADYCSLVTSCSFATYQTTCIADPSGYWGCFCYEDGSLYSYTQVPFATGDICATGASYCGVPSGG